jgi:hypothetical protein
MTCASCAASVTRVLRAQPGVRDSWGQFGTYVAANVLATQRLLEALRQHPVARLVYASSSSAYGDAPAYPVFETDLPRPRSPYGVTKLAAEQLCVAYAANFGISSVSLRYFTVYGPRQRPDMATNRLIAAARFGPIRQANTVVTPAFVRGTTALSGTSTVASLSLSLAACAACCCAAAPNTMRAPISGRRRSSGASKRTRTSTVAFWRFAVGQMRETRPA